MTKVIILNDTTRDKGHIGCQLVMDNLHKLCWENDWDVLFTDKDCHNDFSEDRFKEKILPADIILLNGEGTLHDDAGLVWLRKARIAKENHKKVYLLNSTWQNNSENKKYLQYFDLLSFRDNKSLQEAQQNGAKNIFSTPDLSFYSFDELRKTEHASDKKLLCIDSTLKNVTAALIKYAYTNRNDICFMYEKRRKYWETKLKYRWLNFWYKKQFEPLNSVEQLSQYQRMVSGRYHACCLAFMIGIPALGIYSNTHKTEALYQEAGLSEFFLPQINVGLKERILSFAETSPLIWQQKCFEYSNQANKKIKSLFRLLKDV